jgi:hypothetical protein
MWLRALGTALLVLLVMVPPAAAEPVKHAAVADFDGDGISDFSVLKPNGGWYIQPSGLRCCWGFTWGYPLPADARPVPADYDGNLSTDPAMYLPADGTWQVMPSNGTGAYIIPFGQPGDQPVPADYDGDGRTDFAVYRPDTAQWFVLGGPTVVFGQTGDIPVPGDYDGDGRADIAMFRPADGTWNVLRSSDGGQTSEAFGMAGDTLVPADYDGDGRMDPAVYRAGSWSIRLSGDGSIETQTLGEPGDLVAPGDYTGDGRTDPAVYRPSTGTWLLLGGPGVTLGSPEDTPVAGTYLPRSATRPQ